MKEKNNFFKTPKYEGAWIPFDGDRMRFRFCVEQVLRDALQDPSGTLSVGESGPEWHGKEKLAGLSYSQTVGWGILVFSRTHVLGVDVERQDRALKENYLKLAKRFFHPTEHTMLETVSIFDGPMAFMELWMKKEAYSKMKRKNLVEFIRIALPEEETFEPLMKIRSGYQGVLAISSSTKSIYY